jgi:hypothetical protein
MSREKATTKQSGGGGFTFADKVAAALMVQMLGRDLGLGVSLGPIAAIDFETKESGNPLDDLQITFRYGAQDTRLFLSVKSNRQLKKSGFDSEFVQDAWDQWTTTEARSGFDPDRDLLGLTLGVVEDVALDDWKTLHDQAVSTTPQRLVDRLKPEGQSNPVQRDIFGSLRADGTAAGRDELETARLMARVRLFPFSDKQVSEAVDLCSRLVASGSLSDAEALWDALLTIAAESRGTGAHFDLPRLLKKLRPRFELRDYPDHEADWSKLQSITTDNIASETRTLLGDGIHLQREDARRKLTHAIQSNDVTVASGESGSGKSAMVAELAIDPAVSRRTLWLTAEQASKASQVELAKSLGLRHTVPELFAGSTVRTSLLVIDGFEQFGETARKNITLWLKEIAGQESTNWKVVLTCQPQSVLLVRDLMADAGIRTYGEFDFEKPTLTEIRNVVQGVPALWPLLLRKELEPILRNLTVLDWVIREEVAQRIPTTRPWIGETEIIDLIWSRWMGTDAKKHARDNFLRTLGQREGDKFAGSVSVDTFDERLELMGELEQQELLRVDQGTVRFRHDLMGDWARYRKLKFAGEELVTTITAAAKNPRWGRGIRLYAQSLAESGSGLDGWKALTAKFSGDSADTQLAADLLLDALLYAPNAEMILEQVWSDLVADDAHILKRLLQRLQHVASIPDFRFQDIEDKSLAETAEALFRIPHPLYWIPALRVLERHAKEIARILPKPAAEVCALWLRTMPVGMPGRKEAAALAVEVAREIQGCLAADRQVEAKSQVIFEALLYAAPEHSEVGQIALQLSGRNPEPDYAIERAAELEEEWRRRLEQWEKKNPTPEARRRVSIPGSTSFRRKRVVPPEPEGPQREIAESFRAAVLNTPSLNGLMSLQANVAREIMLAVCIHEPEDEARDDEFDRLMGDHLGLADWKEGSPALPWKGGFDRFLAASPETGLDTIIRLVNYATAKWLVSIAGPNLPAQEREKWGLTLDVGMRQVLWIGDGNVLAWNRLMAARAPQVECALMALEQWLGEEISKGHNIDRWIEYLFEHGESIAFAGVLISVGLKYPILFTNVLQPLLGNYYLYDWQQAIAVAEPGKHWAIGLLYQPPLIVQSAIKWHDHAHRACLLRDIGVRLMLQHPATRNYLAARSAIWKQTIKVKGKAEIDLDFFLARFDPSNYTEKPVGDDCVEITMKWPEHLQKIADETLPVTEMQMLALRLAGIARQILNGHRALPESQLADFAKKLRGLAKWRYSVREEANGHYRVSSLAGGLAVLVIKHRSWLASDPELEEWVFQTLRALKPAFPPLHDPRGDSLDTAESFLGEAAAALLSESDEEWVRIMAFEGATATTYRATFDTMWRAYQLRPQLGPAFDELVNVVLYWSAIRRTVSGVSGIHSDETALVASKRALRTRFLNGKLKLDVSLSRITRLGGYLNNRFERRELTEGQREWRIRSKAERAKERDEFHREMPDIDVEILRRGLGYLQSAVVDSERQLPRDLRLLDELFTVEVGTFPKRDTEPGWRSIYGTPLDFDRWILQMAASRMAYSGSLDEARRLYQPLLAVGPIAHYWLEEFFRDWVNSGLQLTRDFASYISIWNDMAECTDKLPDWQPAKPGWYCPAEYVVHYLIGIHEDQIKTYGERQYRPIVLGMASAMNTWTERWLGHASMAQWYANFITTDSGKVLLAQGIRQFARYVGGYRDEDWSRYGLGTLLSKVLSVAWLEFRSTIESDAQFRADFLTILTTLCAKLVPEALNLRGKVVDALNVNLA